ncbi:MAG: hypothetical protein HZB51_02815 [Chloroflexi bacterium]|nr:hypothetical protein [Chloroflexota bacterium]
MRRALNLLACLGLGIFGALRISQAQPIDPGQNGIFTVAETSVTISNASNGHSIATKIYFPASGNNIDPSGAPYPTLVFSHGFIPIGSPTDSYTGNVMHLASWGYIVALPSFGDALSGDNLTPRISDVRAVLVYLESANANSASPFYQRIDTTRFGIIGHSLGGMSSLDVAGQDPRVKAVVALDPAGASGMSFGSASVQATATYTDLTTITGATLIVGAASSLCNNNAEYNAMYTDVGAEHKAKPVVANGSHCDFLDPSDTTYRNLCYSFCGGGSFNADRLTLAKKLSVAWFNYYLKEQSSQFTYLYGTNINQDLQAGKLSNHTFQTMPRGFTASAGFNAVNLSWQLSSYAVIQGYNLYRSTTSGNYPAPPSTQVGRQANHADSGVAPGTRYFYILQSRDASGNEHQSSLEASAIPLNSADAIPCYLPYITK